MCSLTSVPRALNGVNVFFAGSEQRQILALYLSPDPILYCTQWQCASGVWVLNERPIKADSKYTYTERAVRNGRNYEARFQDMLILLTDEDFPMRSFGSSKRESRSPFAVSSESFIMDAHYLLSRETPVENQRNTSEWSVFVNSAIGPSFFTSLESRAKDGGKRRRVQKASDKVLSFKSEPRESEDTPIYLK